MAAPETGSLFDRLAALISGGPAAVAPAPVVEPEAPDADSDTL